MDRLVAQILREYELVLEELVERKLLIDSNKLVLFESEQRTMLSWSKCGHLSYLFGSYADLNNYSAILDHRDFCLCFNDGGLVQIRYDIEDGNIVSHRLCYFPCPFSFTSEDFQEIALAELPLLFNADELRGRIRLTSPVRFDFDAEKSDNTHAHSHISLNKDTCRIPAYGPISPGHFLRFILRYFYETEFLPPNDWDELKPRLYQRTLRYPSSHELYFETDVDYA